MPTTELIKNLYFSKQAQCLLPFKLFQSGRDFPFHPTFHTATGHFEVKH